MKLETFCKERGAITQLTDRLAKIRRQPAQPNLVSRLLSGDRKASLELALDIEDATNGKVPAGSVPISPSARRCLRRIRANDKARDFALGRLLAQ